MPAKRDLRKELKMAKKEKRRCKKLYADWKDDEFNCGPLKFIFGVKSKDDLSDNNVSTHTLNDLDIFYNRDTKKYLLNIETIYEWSDSNSKVNYLSLLLENFKVFLLENNLFDFNFDPYILYIYNDGNLFISDNLTELYYKFKIFVVGYTNL